jgi:exodeoxyribonuclease III
MRPLRVLSWNVNGIRACHQKGLGQWLARSRASIVGLQEVRAFPDQVPDAIRRSRWRQHYAPAKRAGYGGVALFSRVEPDSVETRLEPRFDVEGRVVIAHFGALSVCNAYFPKGDGPNRDLSRIPYKLAFYRSLLRRLADYDRVIVMGDFNTAHREIDLARSPGRAARLRPLHPRRVRRHVSILHAGGRALQLVGPAARAARAQRRVAHRLRARESLGDAVLAPRVHSKERLRQRPLPGGRRLGSGGDGLNLRARGAAWSRRSSSGG